MDWYTYSQMIMDKCKEREIPYHIGLELTPLCNFDCSMCYVHLSPEEAAKQGRMLTTKQWIYLAEEAKKLGAVTMEITGGEAITRTDFPILYKCFIEMGYLIVLRTNGYLIKGKILELLKKYKPRAVMITLYGASDETYQKVCGIRDGFSIVTSNILKLKEAGITVRLSSTITNENMEDVKLMREWADEHGLNFTTGGHLFTPRPGSNRNVEKLQIRYPDENYHIPEEMKPVHREIPDREKYMNPFWMCRLFGAKLSISWDGKMVICNSNPAVRIDPFATSLGEAYHEMYRKLKAIRRPEKCNDCEYIDLCTVCPSMLYSSTGNMEQTNNDMCKYAYRAYKNRILMESQQEVVDGISAEKCDEGEE